MANEFDALNSNVLVEHEVEQINPSKTGRTPAEKKKAIIILGVALASLAGLGGLGYSMMGSKKDIISDAGASVTKPVATDAATDPLDFSGRKAMDAPPPPPNMALAATVAPAVDQAALDAQAQAEALRQARLKSSVIIQDGGSKVSAGAAAQGDTSGLSQMPPELQAIFGAAAAGGAGNGGMGDGQGGSMGSSMGGGGGSRTASQGGRFDMGSNIAPSARANHIEDRQYKILQGKLIRAVLFTDVKSDIPGAITAVVSEPVYGEQGRYQLLPAGTRLYGEYSSEVKYGQAEVAAVWRRAITPQGVQINLDSPSANALGITGLGGGRVNNHFFQTFGTAALLSLIGAGSSTTGASTSDRQNSISAYRDAARQSFADSANNVLKQRANIPPTITISHGTEVIVLVAKDLDFTDLVM